MTAETPRPAHPEPEPFFSRFHEDMDRQYVYFGQPGMLTRLVIFLEFQGCWAVAAYRFGRRLKTHPIPLINPLLWVLFRLYEAFARVTTGIYLDVDAKIGPGLYVGHFGAIYVGPGVVIGRDFSIGQTCFVGPGGAAESPGLPVIGDRVHMGVGSKIVGGIRIGNDVALGANAVAVTDLPDSSVAVGNPAVIANMRGSGSFVRLRNRPGGENATA